MARDQMVLFRSEYEAGMEIENPKERLAFFEAIFALGLNDEDRTSSLPRFPKAIFLAIKPIIEKGNKCSTSRKVGIEKKKIDNSKNNNERANVINGLPYETIAVDCNENNDSEIVNQNANNDSKIVTDEKSDDLEIAIKGKDRIGKDSIGLDSIGLDGGEAPLNPPAADAASHTDETEGWKPCEATYGKPKAQTRFAAPTVEEVAAYCKERGNKVDAGRFCDFYTAKGWKVGNTPMKDWRAAVRNWERTDKQAAQSGGSSFDRDEFWEHAMADSLAKHGRGELKC